MASGRNLAGLAIELVPVAFVAGAAAFGVHAIATSNPGWLLGGLGVLYLLPPLVHRVHDLVAPLEEGDHPIVGTAYVPWWGSHQIQAIYLAFPSLEAALRLVPGLYSAWLRLWGARIGRRVTWTSRVVVGDRSLLDIGDGVVFGYEAGLSGHVIGWRDGRLMLYVGRCTVGAGAVIGAQAVVGPGVVVAPGVTVPGRTGLHPKSHYP